MYLTTINNKETPDQRIFHGSQTIRNPPGNFESVRQSTIRRLHAFNWSRWGKKKFEYVVNFDKN